MGGLWLDSLVTTTPEIDKMYAVKDRSQAIGEFLEWLQQEKRWELAAHHEHDHHCYAEDRRICQLSQGELLAVNYSIEKLLAEFFEINLSKVDDEKRAILKAFTGAARK